MNRQQIEQKIADLNNQIADIGAKNFTKKSYTEVMMAEKCYPQDYHKFIDELGGFFYDL